MNYTEFHARIDLAGAETESGTFDYVRLPQNRFAATKKTPRIRWNLPSVARWRLRVRE